MTDQREPTRFISINQFMDMMGFKAASSYYNHIDDEGWPQRVWPGGTSKPMLVLAECEEYMAKIIANRVPPTKPFVKAKAGAGARARHRGRPAKVLRASEGGA